MVQGVINTDSGCFHKLQSNKIDIVVKTALAALSLSVASLLTAPWQITFVVVAVSGMTTALMVLSLLSDSDDNTESTHAQNSNLPTPLNEGLRENARLVQEIDRRAKDSRVESQKEFQKDLHRHFEDAYESLERIKSGNSEAYRSYKCHLGMIENKISLIKIRGCANADDLQKWAERNTENLKEAYHEARSVHYARIIENLKSELETSVSEIKETISIKKYKPEDAKSWLEMKISQNERFVTNCRYSNSEFADEIKHDGELKRFVNEQIESINVEFNQYYPPENVKGE